MHATIFASVNSALPPLPWSAWAWSLAFQVTNEQIKNYVVIGVIIFALLLGLGILIAFAA